MSTSIMIADGDCSSNRLLTARGFIKTALSYN